MIKVYQTIECKNNLITTIPFKGVKVKVEFKGGNIMKGIHASLYTNDPFVQRALDESNQKGHMYRFVREVKEAGDEKSEAAVQPPQQKKQPNPENPADTDIDPNPHFPATEPPVTTEPPVSEGEDGKGADGATKYEFDNLAEAITFIAANWGEQVENANQARKFIEEKTGVKAVIHNG